MTPSAWRHANNRRERERDWPTDRERERLEREKYSALLMTGKEEAGGIEVGQKNSTNASIVNKNLPAMQENIWCVITTQGCITVDHKKHQPYEQGWNKKKISTQQFFTRFVVLLVKNWWPRGLPFCTQQSASVMSWIWPACVEQVYKILVSQPFSALHWWSAYQYDWATRSSNSNVGFVWWLLSLTINETLKWLSSLPI